MNRDLLILLMLVIKIVFRLEIVPGKAVLRLKLVLKHVESKVVLRIYAFVSK